MRNKSLMTITIAVILALMVGPSLGTTVSMPSGTQSISVEAGKAVGYVTYSFDYDANSIQADILAVATATGKGTVTSSAYANVASTATGSETTIAGAPTGLVVTGKGTVDVKVKGDTGALVTSVAQIHSKASKGANALDGEAWIYSGIGQTWTGVVGPDYQKGELTGAPLGMFEADSTADGVATYSGALNFPGQGDSQDLSISGSAAGKTTLQSEVNYEEGSIGGYIAPGGISPTLPAEALVSSKSGVSGTLVGNKLTAGTIYARNYNEISIAAANSRDFCEENPEGGLTFVSGTATGTAENNKAAAKSYYDKCDPLTGECDKETFAANTEKADSMSADVRVFTRGDIAYANALVNPEAKVTGTTDKWISSASNTVKTYGLVSRFVPGDQAKQDAGSEERVYGKAAIGSGSWSANAYHELCHRTPYPDLVDTKTTSKASVSGELAKVTKNDGDQPTGMSATAFLLFKKENAQALVSNTQSSEANEDTDKLTTSIKNEGALLGPRAKSLGGVSSWDGEGFYASLENLGVSASDDSSLKPVKAISTSVPDTQAYMWVDGTNDAMYNGPGFIVDPYPTMTPFGTYTGVQFSFTPSMTERKTEVKAETSQIQA